MLKPFAQVTMRGPSGGQFCILFYPNCTILATQRGGHGPMPPSEIPTRLVYSLSNTQIKFCEYCTLFANQIAEKQRFGTFVSTPYTNFRKATELIASPASKSYHQTAKTKAENFSEIYRSSAGNVVERMTTGRRNQALVNRKIMKSIVGTVVFCGRQNIPLRGHRDYGRLDDHQDFQTDETKAISVLFYTFEYLLGMRIYSNT